MLPLYRTSCIQKCSSPSTGLPVQCRCLTRTASADSDRFLSGWYYIQAFAAVLAWTCHQQTPVWYLSSISGNCQTQAEACLLPIVQDMASVPDPTYFLLLTFMQMLQASGYVSAHSTTVGIEDWQLVRVFGVSPVDRRQERGFDALSTVVRMQPNVKLVSLVWQHTVWSASQCQKV